MSAMARRAGGAALLFLAVMASAQAQSDGVAADDSDLPDVYYDVGHQIMLNCTLPNPDKKPIVWSKNGTAVTELWDLRERVRLPENGERLIVPVKTQEDDYGNYTCTVGSENRTWVVHGRPHAKLPANTNVVEGEKLKLQCRVTGKPHSAVSWRYVNASAPEEDNGTAVEEALGGRALVSGDLGERLELERTERGDAGRFVCALRDGTNATTVLRVKDMYAALWPFLGVCAEVFVLCAVILVYERRRTKPELDDSDTDNHEQKKS